MKVGLVGLQGGGKSTVFQAMTSLAGVGPGKPGQVAIGVVKVPDERLAYYAGVFNPKKLTAATVEFLDFPPIGQGGNKGDAELIGQIRKVDAIACVVDAFGPGKDQTWKSDLETVRQEFALADLMVAEKRISSLEKAVMKSTATQEQDKKELALLKQIHPLIEKAQSLQSVAMPPEDQKRIRGFQFLLGRPWIALVNVAEGAPTGEIPKSELPAGYDDGLRLSGKVEQEIAELPEGERGAFLKELGISEPAVHRFIAVSYRALGWITFLTVGEDEVRAWTLKKGLPAVEAAGTIHTDLARGFIRAEVVSHADFVACGGFAEVKAKGKLHLQGKEYVVQDGDILNIRFSV